jgi:hypothetical protein
MVEETDTFILVHLTGNFTATESSHIVPARPYGEDSLETRQSVLIN